MEIYLADESATLNVGKQLARLCPDQAFTLHLEGDLGSAKTTLCRGLIQQLGHKGSVKSPTYTLVERYDLAAKLVFHCDLYRLSDPYELDLLGLYDYASQNALCLIEWAQQGGDYLPTPDLMVTLRYQNEGRLAIFSSYSAAGQILCDNLDK